MRIILLCLGLFVVVTGCTGINIKAENGMIVRTASDTNMFSPSLAVMEVSKCVPDTTGNYEEVDINGEKVGCYGKFVPFATVQGTQPGALSGIGSAAIQGGAIVGGSYLLADGIRDSGDSTNLNNDSNSSSNSRSVSKSNSSSRASSLSKSRSNSSSMSNGNGNNGRGGMD